MLCSCFWKVLSGHVWSPTSSRWSQVLGKCVRRGRNKGEILSSGLWSGYRMALQRLLQVVCWSSVCGTLNARVKILHSDPAPPHIHPGPATACTPLASCWCTEFLRNRSLPHQILLLHMQWNRIGFAAHGPTAEAEAVVALLNHCISLHHHKTSQLTQCSCYSYQQSATSYLCYLRFATFVI